jgi:hypothetical protein
MTRLPKRDGQAELLKKVNFGKSNAKNSGEPGREELHDIIEKVKP